jgi:hypothetical protein
MSKIPDPKPPIIFLDFDGVLNSSRFVKDLGEKWTMNEIDPVAVQRLNKIVEATGAKIVISSTWRILSSLDELKKIIADNGGRVDIIGETPDLGWERGHEIQAWLDGNPGHDNFIILDDNSDMVHLTPRLIQSTWEYGLQEIHVDAAITALTKGVQQCF